MNYTSILNSNKGLFIFLSIVSLYSWIIMWWWKRIINIYNPLIIIILSGLINGLLLTIVLTKTYKITDIIKNINQIAMKDYIHMLLFSISTLIIAYYGVSIFLHHKVEDIRLTEFVSSILVNTLVIYLFINDRFTKTLFLGLCMVGIGGYLILN